MTVWDILDDIIKIVPPVLAVLFFLTVGIIFAIGFFKHGVNFIKYGFKQMVLDSSLEKRFDSLEAKFDARFAKIDERFAQIDERFAQIDGRFVQIDGRFAQIDSKILAIETNHFGHLKNFLTELTSILVDKDILNNTDKARLDNHLRGM